MVVRALRQRTISPSVRGLESWTISISTSSLHSVCIPHQHMYLEGTDGRTEGMEYFYIPLKLSLMGDKVVQ